MRATSSPIRIGYCLSVTGPVADNSRSAQLAHQIWREDTNRQSGLLGRPVELVCYDYHADASQVPGIYKKLMDEDKVDLVFGGYGTNSLSPAMPLIMERQRFFVGLMGLGVNNALAYPNYFAMIPTGPDPNAALTEGFFAIAAQQKPQPATVALVSVIEYKSCRNRHCPKCHSRTRDQWLADREGEILPVPYCHVVFTLPHELAPLALQNPRVIYGILFRAVAEALLEMAADPKRLGAKIGCLAVLHTWNQQVMHHPHMHCVVPAGGLSPDGKRWISCRKKFFLPVKPLGCLFRGKFLAFLEEAFDAGELDFYGQLRDLAHPARFRDWLFALKQKKWVVYAKPPFGGPDQVLRYLARYTHRVAISNGRLLSLENGCVRFRWRDSQDGNQIKEMSLDAIEFIRRYLLHVLPSGFVKIRHFGFLANRNRKAMLQLCRTLLPASATLPIILKPHELLCPVCKIGHLHLIEWQSPPQSFSNAISQCSAAPLNSS